MDTKEKLDQLANLNAQIEVLNIEEAELIAKATPPEVAQRLDEIRAEYADKFEAVHEKVKILSDEIKAEVLATGTTIKGSFLQAVYAKGRVTWDGKKLDGMMSIIPALADARKEGEPSVSFRNVK